MYWSEILSFIAAIFSLIVALLAIIINIRKSRKQKDKYVDQSITIGDNAAFQHAIIGGNKNIIVEILNDVDKKTIDKDRSISYKEKGRSKIQAWGTQMSKRGVWNWRLLGQALEYLIDSIKFDIEHQYAWTNLAYVYYLIGDFDKSKYCLKKSFDLASPGPNHPGRTYKKVKAAIDNNTYLTGGKITRPEIPEWFSKDYDLYLK